MEIGISIQTCDNISCGVQEDYNFLAKILKGPPVQVLLTLLRFV